MSQDVYYGNDKHKLYCFLFMYIMKRNPATYTYQLIVNITRHCSARSHHIQIGHRMGNLIIMICSVLALLLVQCVFNGQACFTIDLYKTTETIRCTSMTSYTSLHSTLKCYQICQDNILDCFALVLDVVEDGRVDCHVCWWTPSSRLTDVPEFNSTDAKLKVTHIFEPSGMSQRFQEYIQCTFNIITIIILY